MLKRIVTAAALLTLVVTTAVAQDGEEDIVVVVRGDERIRVVEEGDVEINEELTIDPREALESDAREAHRMNRGLIAMSSTFIPSGQWIVGATGSYSAHENNNYTFTLIEGIESEGYTVKASPFLLYAFADNKAAGGRFVYRRALTRIYDASFSIGSDDEGVEIVVNDFYSLSNVYTAMAVFRQYIPFGNSKRFAFFADITLEGGGFQSKFAHDVPVKGTYATGYTFGLGVTPGLVAFATNDVAFEVSMGIAGLSYSHTDQVHNQVYFGDIDTSSFNFSLNLLSIGVGVSFYL